MVAMEQQHVPVWSRALVLAAVVVGVLASLVAIVLDIVSYRVDPDPFFSAGWTGALPGLAMLIPGALLQWRLPRNPIAIILTVFGLLWAVDGTASAYLNWALAFDPDAPGTQFAFWFYVRFGAILVLPIQLVLLLFPDGRLPRRGPWRVAAFAALAIALVMPLSSILAPSHILLSQEPEQAAMARYDQPPITLPLTDEAWHVIADVAFPTMLFGTVLALVVTMSRRIGADAVRRSQLRWLIWAGALFVIGVLVGNMLPQLASDIIGTIDIALLCTAVVIAVARYRLYEIDRLVSWTLVYGLLVASVFAVDLLVLAALGAVIDQRSSALVAVIAVTVVYAPLRERIFRFVSRLVNGRREDPYGAVSALADALEAAKGPGEQLERIADSVAEAFASGYVRVELERPDGRRLTAEHGRPSDRDTAELPLEYRGRTIGRIVMEPGRRPRLSRRDRKLLGDLVRQAAAAVLNSELSAELQRIREGLVSAREEERSRIRRDLHDGLGPMLAGVKLRLELARTLVQDSPDRAIDALDSAITDASEAVADIRRLVHDLRPPALDDLGLARAVDQQAERFRGGLAIEVDARVPRDLPAAAEVAAYRIVSEALTNIAKHAQASRAWIRLDQTGDTLVAEVADDGIGIPADAVPGIGLASGRERALELGGSLDIVPRDGGGTVLRAVLPTTRSQEAAHV